MSPRLVALCAVVFVSACNCGPAQGGPCTDDAQCDLTGEGFLKCDTAAGICLCVDSRGCGPNESCNAAGRCQAESGCSTNDDCGGSDFFCDTTTSQCLSVLECSPADGQRCCTRDDQCPFRQVCGATLSCVEGCRDEGDCLLGEGCVVGGFGELGQCGNTCTSDAQCPPQHLCNIAAGKCELDQRGPYCLACTGGVESTDCGAFGNYCLIDDVNVGAAFCGVECAQNQACPSGYACHDVIIVPPSTPQCGAAEVCVVQAGQTTGTCSRNTDATCTTDRDCPEGPPGADCAKQLQGRRGSCFDDTNIACGSDSDCPTGTCNLIECRGSEGGLIGFCTCTRNSDCPSDTCKDADNSDPARPIIGHCELSGHACLSDVECDVITCVDGGCFIGRNCAPSNDRTCADLQATPAQ